MSQLASLIVYNGTLRFKKELNCYIDEQIDLNGYIGSSKIILVPINRTYAHFRPFWDEIKDQSQNTSIMEIRPKIQGISQSPIHKPPTIPQYDYLQYFKLMKSRKNRKGNCEGISGTNLRLTDCPALFRVKFDVSKDNISCFMGSKTLSKKVSRKPSRSLNRGRKSNSKAPSSRPANPVIKQAVKTAKREESPDIIKEASNTILSKIQQNGINCVWNQNQRYEEQVEQGENQNEISLWSAFDSSREKSYASTNDFPHYHTVTANFEWPTQKIPTYTNSFNVQIEFIERDWRTTLMIRNIPNKYTIHELSAEIDSEHANTYDFLYLPCDLKNQCNVGYGFINFINTTHLLSFFQKFDRYIWKKYKSEKICALTYARLQGLTELIEHFENSKVLNQKEKKYRPIIKYEKIHKMVLEQQSR